VTSGGIGVGPVDDAIEVELQSVLSLALTPIVVQGGADDFRGVLMPAGFYLVINPRIQRGRQVNVSAAQDQSSSVLLSMIVVHFWHHCKFLHRCTV
jgi:hypothetical protein